LCYQRKLSQEVLFLEFQEFVEYGLLEGNRERFAEPEIQDLSAYLDRLSKEISTAPLTLVHRDYQSRNILLFQNRPWILDYQDACLGPFTYDLASLIYDRKMNLSEEMREEFAKEFWEGTYAKAPICTFSEFIRYLKLTAMQRMCKSIGRRSKTAFKRGQRPDYLIDIEPALNTLNPLWISLGLDQRMLEVITRILTLK
jgi:N-acetylmuramate 1-kinase